MTPYLLIGILIIIAYSCQILLGLKQIKHFIKSMVVYANKVRLRLGDDQVK
jgi:hypothetical protein